jgi:DNA-binding NarL/FixJ family response regulator
VTILRPVRESDVRVLIACSRSLLRAGYRAVLDGEPHVAVAAEAGSGREAVDLARELGPDAVLMDIDIADSDCVEATSEICAGGVRVVLLSSVEDDHRIFAALRAGASGVLSKDTEPEELVRGIRVAARGDSVLSPGLTRLLIAELVSRPEPGRPSEELLAALTSREREVVTLVARGLSNDEIAEQLVVSSATARTHVSRAMVKLRARDRAQLVVFAYQARLLAHPPRP